MFVKLRTQRRGKNGLRKKKKTDTIMVAMDKTTD
jgi:hypothetical protein